MNRNQFWYISSSNLEQYFQFCIFSATALLHNNTVISANAVTFTSFNITSEIMFNHMNQLYNHLSWNQNQNQNQSHFCAFLNETEKKHQLNNSLCVYCRVLNHWVDNCLAYNCTGSQIYKIIITSANLFQLIIEVSSAAADSKHCSENRQSFWIVT